jgi:pimeloyl-ACP methyl ester carboxylesterase
MSLPDFKKDMSTEQVEVAVAARDAITQRSRWKPLGIVFLVALVVLGVYAWLHPLAVVRSVGRFALWCGGIHSEYSKVGPYRIHYYEGGEGPPLIFIHGLGAESINWVPAMLTFRRQFHVYAIDLLGHGQSEKPDIAYSIAQQTEMVRQFLADRGAKPADVVGISMGGWVTLRLAIDHPDAVNRIIVADAAGLKFQTSITVNSFLPANHEEFKTFMAMLTPRLHDAPYPLRRDFLGRVSRNAWITRRIFDSFLTYKDVLDGQLQQVKAPALVIWGKEENLLPMSLGWQMQQQIPSASMLVCTDSGHLAIYECWNQVRPFIADFLSAKQPVAPYVSYVAIDAAAK